ncbi:MAG: DivIVA domain-containing protein [Microbacteriaceae bacterium]|nr:DivIVA domain-containing protein [Microbacteriaceae bacterium]
MATFPLISAPARGYNVDAVDAFIARAQAGDSTLTSSDIRWASFPISKGGYSIVDVDAALERLEDTVAEHELQERVKTVGMDESNADARAIAQDVLNRVARAPRKRFRRAPIFTYGYHRADVDEFADTIRAFYNDGGNLTRTDVRTVSFRPQLGGYDEAQVDFVLDELLRVMLAAR